MNRYEMLLRKTYVLASYGYSMDYFGNYIDDPDFLSVEWLESYFGGEPVEDYVKKELDAIDEETDKETEPTIENWTR